MKLKIGTEVICKPKAGSLAGREFLATIVDIKDDSYIVEDQDSDMFDLEEDEVSENTDEAISAEEARRGKLLAEVFQLRASGDYSERWHTSWGTKTAIGLYAVAKRIIEEGK